VCVYMCAYAHAHAHAFAQAFIAIMNDDYYTHFGIE